mmetsp:Transcript_29285/g.70566  ORF Transcript_29285/g.70566 Transcript_29285/m.70566 type:complete len:802 (+) Transcript_29285:1047-3452(+)
MGSLDNHDLKASAAFRSPDLKLFYRDVRQSKKRPIEVRSWSTIKDVKQVIHKQIHVPVHSQRLFFGPLLTSGKELPNHRTLHDAGIYKSGETLLLDIQASSSRFGLGVGGGARSLVAGDRNNDLIISSSIVNATPRALRRLVHEARRGLAMNLKPAFILDGSGGTYFLHNARKAKIAVFKPADEEPYAANNPRGYLPAATGPSSASSGGASSALCLREGVVPGEACIREVAAFMLDHKGFSGVPMTTLVECRAAAFNNNGSRLTVAEGGASMGSHSLNLSSGSLVALGNCNEQANQLPRKAGSFQEFVRSEYTMDDLSPSKISVDEVHKIAVLDIRLMNADRNSANLLCRRRRDNTIELVPIDHGFCLRSVADVSWMDWCWLDWPQLKEPMSQKTKDYILNLDIEKDAQVLREHLNLGSDALDYFYASSSILKAGTQVGLSLYDIAVMCCRNDDLGEIPSKLEVLFDMARELAHNAVQNGRWHHAAASQALAQQLSPQGTSLLSPTPGKGFGKRAQSAFDLNQLAHGLENIGQNTKTDGAIPGMIHSAGSDSSSESGDAEGEQPDDCEEWAANLIADVSMTTSTRFFNSTKPRSPSIESDGSSESGGFWQKSPGSVSDSSLDGSIDEDSVSWSSNSPGRDVLEDSYLHDSRMSYNPFDTARRGSLIFDTINESKIGHGLVDESSRPLTRAPSKVTFLEPMIEKTEETKLKHSNSDVGEKPGLLKLSNPKSLKRSQSYSAMPSTHAEYVCVVEEVRSNKRSSLTEDQELQYRDYYLKFVDLVIARETTTAATSKMVVPLKSA